MKNEKSDEIKSKNANLAGGHLPLLLELIGILKFHPWLFVFAVIPNIFLAVINPVRGWLAKNVLNEISKGNTVFVLSDLLPYGWIALGIFCGLGLLQLAEKVTNRMFDDRMLIELQRVWFIRCGNGCPGERVARSINDCENARKMFDLFQKEFWTAVVGLPAVFIWQMSLAPKWLPALFMAVIPPFMIALLFGRLIQRTSLRILQFVSAVGSAFASGDKSSLYMYQENFYRNRVRFELWKQCSEATAEFSRWLGVVLVLAISVTGIWQVIPAEVSAGEIGLFLVNLGLIAKPLLEITKVHNKIREGWPAVQRVFRPECGIDREN